MLLIFTAELLLDVLEPVLLTEDLEPASVALDEVDRLLIFTLFLLDAEVRVVKELLLEGVVLLVADDLVEPARVALCTSGRDDLLV